MKYLVKNKSKKEGLVTICDGAKSGLKYLSLKILSLGKGKVHNGRTGDKELVAVLLNGRICVEASGISATTLARKSVFAGKASAFYLPSQSSYRIRAGYASTVALIFAPSTADKLPRLILPEDVVVNVYGQHNWQRDVHNIATHDTVDCERLIVGETFNQPGCWSSFPPHCHEKNRPPLEAQMEEVYYFKVDPPQGFGIQKLYTDDRSIDETYTVEDGDTTILPKGYHPVAAAAGYSVYYLWLMAGVGRVLYPRDDPDHAWIKGAEAIIPYVGR